MTRARAMVTVAIFAVALGILMAASASAGPTCSAEMGIAVHGQHIIGDYVTGSGTDWPPGGGGVGSAIGGTGVAIQGGPGPGFHFVIGAAPGASFCNSQSSSPGWHL